MSIFLFQLRRLLLHRITHRSYPFRNPGRTLYPQSHTETPSCSFHSMTLCDFKMESLRQFWAGSDLCFALQKKKTPQERNKTERKCQEDAECSFSEHLLEQAGWWGLTQSTPCMVDLSLFNMNVTQSYQQHLSLYTPRMMCSTCLLAYTHSSHIEKSKVCEAKGLCSVHLWRCQTCVSMSFDL